MFSEREVRQMDMTLTAKIKIYPTAEQAEVLKATLSAYRQACNAV
ncbi:helix-turn-helix domain-containing protein, partial [Geobacillus sp. LEMMJ02]